MSTGSQEKHSFVYVPESEYMPVQNQLMKLVDMVSKSVQDTLKFRIKFVGSSSRGMITKDLKSNTGYDFDLNIIIDPKEKNYDPKSLKDFLRNHIDKYAPKFGYSNCEDSTSVLTIKAIDTKNSKIIHSADFNITRKLNGEKQYILNDKKTNTYSWATSPKFSVKQSQMIDWCKKNGHWEEVKDKYLIKKNENSDPNKKSRMIFADTVNEIYNKYLGK